ncbi:4-(cytidine 5'-diphospho)-2-C-methyl-D-erythritol kinase [Clavibacter tessellarius]|uniref:4-(cytidine 5'-diphospho)-2-C-methyl-D-erythritol kinase n=1 Tax=Clavibacter tessellarius TaxID=31965 RepID=UPI00324C767F
MTSAASTSDVVHARAPGKINVSLTVGALQEDGYHDVATAYQAVSLYEDVYATRSDGFSVEFGGSIDTSHLTVGADNLAIRAARLLARSTGYRGGVHLRIEKNVPIAGGMGGGSADAAATLLACDTLWGTERTRDQLLALGAELGADVPFALAGGTAIGTGRGDRLSPALAKGTFQWVLAIAEFGVSTPDVYGEARQAPRAARAGHLPGAADPAGRLGRAAGAAGGDPHMLAEVLHNDLQAPALHLAPGLGEVLQLGEENGALAGIVSGSGPTVAFLAADLDGALELQIALSAARLTVIRATGPVHGARIITG